VRWRASSTGIHDDAHLLAVLAFITNSSTMTWPCPSVAHGNSGTHAVVK